MTDGPGKRSDRTTQHYTPAGGVTEQADSYTDFMCDCQPEGKQRCDECVERVCKELKCEPSGLVSAVVYSITWGSEKGVGFITGIPCDQWCAVTADFRPHNEDGEVDDAISFFIQCDKVEYGFARLWELMKEATQP